ncbi:MAG: alpha/beta fold hydrolase [Planctomycetota bacterium]
MDLVDAFAAFVGTVPYREARLPGGKVRVWDMGEGPPLVLLHGIAASRRIFFRVTPLLAARHRVIAPPLRGEDRPAPRATHAALVDDLAALLDDLALDGVTLFGTSFGGTLALAYAARRDPRVAQVIVQGAFARFPLRPFDRAAHALSYLFPAGVGAAYFRRRVRRGPETRLLAEHAPGLEVLLPDWSAGTPFATLRRRIRVISRMNLAAEVKRIDVPLTFAHGEKDRVVPRAHFEELRGLRPDSRSVLWDDVGHNAVLTHPQHIVALLDSSSLTAGSSQLTADS